jgi:hypothetical protein
MNASTTTYWENLYAYGILEQRSWYQPQALASLRLFETTALSYDAPILDVGAGHSPFLTALLERGYANLIAADCSATALHQLRQQLPEQQAGHVLWVVDDVTAPQHLFQLEPVLLWHDRGLLHGVLGAPAQAAYRRLLDYMVLAHGWVLLGVLAPTPHGPLADGGLLVQPYDVAGLAAFLGEGYALRHVFDEVHLPPQGSHQPYTYALFQRHNAPSRGLWVPGPP